jgi:hypothetical protein
MKHHGVVLFYTSSMVFRAEKILLKAGIPGKLIPTPRELSSDCGIALQFEWVHLGDVQKALQVGGVEIADLCPLPEDIADKSTACHT